MSRGYFEIGVWHPKTEANVGTLWRTAYQMGAAGIFVIGPRYPARQSSDTVKAWRHIPLRRYDDVDALVATLPYSCPLVGVEMGGKPLGDYHHQERACYLLGAEDHGLPAAVLRRCTTVLELPSVRTASFNVAVAGAMVMYHRLTAP